MRGAHVTRLASCAASWAEAGIASATPAPAGAPDPAPQGAWFTHHVCLLLPGFSFTPGFIL